MSDYENKIEELKELCRWFNEHTDEVMRHDDGVVIAAVYGEPEHITNIAVGNAELVSEILTHVAMGCREDYIRQGAN